MKEMVPVEQETTGTQEETKPDVEVEEVIEDVPDSEVQPEVAMEEPTNEPVARDEEPKNSVTATPSTEFSPNKSDRSSRTYKKPEKKRGRQRKKSGTSADDGVKQLFFLWWDEGKGKSFGTFYRDDLSDDMCDDTWGYYPVHFISTKGKSHGEYVQWRREYRSKFGRKIGTTEFSADTDGTKILPFRRA